MPFCGHRRYRWPLVEVVWPDNDERVSVVGNAHGGIEFREFDHDGVESVGFLVAKDVGGLHGCGAVGDRRKSRNR